MAETINISIIANKIADRVTSRFGWKLAGAFDTNYQCLNSDHEKETHPYDCVFYYEDPREKKTVYLLTDLKSYSSATLNSRSFRSTLQDLAKSVECARISNEWKSQIGILDDSTSEINGLLFIYNHDKEYDKQFKNHLKKISNVDLDCPEDTKVFVFGPNDINFLEVIVNDMERAATQLKIGDIKNFKYFYPRKILKPIPESSLERLPIELMLSPLIVVYYDQNKFDGSGRAKGYIIYYKGKGESVEEFHYLLNYILQQRLLSSDLTVEIRAPYLEGKAHSNFERARETIVMQYHDIRSFKTRLEELTLNQIPISTQSYSEDKIGIDRKNRKSQ